MKKLAYAGAALLALGLVAVTTTARATQSDRVTVCHITGNANDVLFGDAVPILGIPANRWEFGRLIEVNENALSAHLAHGNSATHRPPPPPGWIVNPNLVGIYWTTQELMDSPFGFGAFFANLFETGQYPNADCGIRQQVFP